MGKFYLRTLNMNTVFITVDTSETYGARFEIHHILPINQALETIEDARRDYRLYNAIRKINSSRKCPPIGIIEVGSGDTAKWVDPLDGNAYIVSENIGGLFPFYRAQIYDILSTHKDHRYLVRFGAGLAAGPLATLIAGLDNPKFMRDNRAFVVSNLSSAYYFLLGTKGTVSVMILDLISGKKIAQSS